jgi:pimeloyl-ACP methyl ester carboxylesterase
MKRAFAELPDGVVHYREAGAGAVVLLLHQTPRSSDEYRGVMPRLAERYRAIAVDTPGFGDSPAPNSPPSIEAYARVALSLLDALGVDSFSVVGHHTGGIIAIELASANPDRVDKLVLSSTSYLDDDLRAERTAATPSFEPQEDGSHLLDIWNYRAPYYPPNRADLLNRYVVSALQAGASIAHAHAAIGKYRMESKLPTIRCPVLLIGAPEDPFGYEQLARLRVALPQARVVELEGGTIPLPDHLPEEFARAVLNFLG